MLLTDKQKLGLLCVILFSLCFILLMHIHLMAALLAGLLTYTLTINLDQFLLKKMYRFSNKSKLISVLLLSMMILLIFIGGFGYLFSIFVNVAKHPVETMNKIQLTLDKVSRSLPVNIAMYLPDNIEEIQSIAINYLKEHVFYFQSIIKHVFHILLMIIIGMIIGFILGFTQNKRNSRVFEATATPFAKAMHRCLNQLVLVFQYVALSQVAIALCNTFLTAFFIFIILPFFGVHLPFAKMLVLITFVFGLIPIIGNLIVNVIIFLVGFSVSFNVAIVILAYLVVIHKLEYILNARIVGKKIHASICELLIAMLFFETLFGMIGLIFAPVFYAFITLSLKELKII